jgi:hypothetical protein
VHEIYHATLEKYLISALKSNHLIALSKEDKANSRYIRTQEQRAHKAIISSCHFMLPTD